MKEKLIFEKSTPGRKAYSLPPIDTPEVELTTLLPEEIIRQEPAQLPELSEG